MNSIGVRTLFLTATCVVSSATLVANERPNIILIVADDLGYGDIGCFGNKVIKTPNIDRMAAAGVKLTDFHTNGALSSPTRAALMTGRYQQRSGVTGVITAAKDREKGLALSEYTLAEALKDCGYTTVMFGKWHLGYAPEFNPINQGFDYFAGFVAGNVDYHSHLDQEMYEDWWSGAKLAPEEGYVTDLIGGKAVDFVKNHKTEPFFLYLPHEAPHYPLQVRSSAPIRGKDAESDANMTKEESLEIYKEMIEILDETVGNLMAALEESGLLGRTIVLFTSDNGGVSSRATNAPLSGGKGGLLEGGHRVPTVLWPPGVALAPMTPYVYTSTIMTMDLFPAFVSLAGGKMPKNLDGVNFLPALKKGEPLSKRNLFWSSGALKAMRQGEWKMVVTKTKAMLFNLADDIGESNDLAAQYPKRAEAMQSAISKWYLEVQPEN